MAPQFLTDIKGNKTGVFQELEDIKAYDKAKKRNERTIPQREAIRLRKKENIYHA